VEGELDSLNFASHMPRITPDIVVWMFLECNDGVVASKGIHPVKLLRIHGTCLNVEISRGLQILFAVLTPLCYATGCTCPHPPEIDILISISS